MAHWLRLKRSSKKGLRIRLEVIGVLTFMSYLAFCERQYYLEQKEYFDKGKEEKKK